jgi:hypothetical protein
MARAKKLRPAAVRTIFTSTEPAPKLASRYKVSANLVYLIRQGKIHKAVTQGLHPPARGRRQDAMRNRGIDTKALADAIIDRFLARLFSRLAG